jgi:nucleotidyltransferase AbiEii toxin of type IV toxin-antitoxin system
LDRQHPRDLFDVMVLLENEGISEEIRKAFVVYLASHDRPMNELLDPTRKDMRGVYESEFAGMTIKAVRYEDLIGARGTLIETLKKELTDAEKFFLVSLKKGQPDWNALAIQGIEKLPAIKWKLMNIEKMGHRKRSDSLEQLKRKLGL